MPELIKEITVKYIKGETQSNYIDIKVLNLDLRNTDEVNVVINEIREFEKKVNRTKSMSKTLHIEFRLTEDNNASGYSHKTHMQVPDDLQMIHLLKDFVMLVENKYNIKTNIDS